MSDNSNKPCTPCVLVELFPSDVCQLLHTRAEVLPPLAPWCIEARCSSVVAFATTKSSAMLWFFTQDYRAYHEDAQGATKPSLLKILESARRSKLWRGRDQNMINPDPTPSVYVTLRRSERAGHPTQLSADAGGHLKGSATIKSAEKTGMPTSVLQRTI